MNLRVTLIQPEGEDQTAVNHAPPSFRSAFHQSWNTNDSAGLRNQVSFCVAR